LVQIYKPENSVDEKYKPNKVVLGAGTGLGKNILIWNKNLESYVPVSSEGGHASIVVKDQQELDLVNYIKTTENRDPQEEVEWEGVLAGAGIQRVYKFLEQTGKYEASEYTKEIKESGYSPKLISKYKFQDSLSNATLLDVFSKFYARCAKCFALETLAFGGVYIAGTTMTRKDPEIFTQEGFLNEFFTNHKMTHLLKQIPIFTIVDEKVGLLGAAVFAGLQKS